MRAVILAGGRGTRFWPLSRARKPKQFLRFFGDKTLLQDTVSRLGPRLSPHEIYVACGHEHADAVRRQLPDLPSDQLLLEPLGRDTAPSIGLASAILDWRFPGGTLAVLPSDHRITDLDEFHSALEAAEKLAQEGWLVTFGIRPTYPATGYGYLGRGKAIADHRGQTAYRVKRFAEKPDSKEAQRLFEDGSYEWNSGMFVWRSDVILKAIDRHLPDLGAGLRELRQRSFEEAALREIFPGFASESIDRGVMEKARRVAVLPCRLGWSDLGGWRALADLVESDEASIAANPEVVLVDSEGVFVHSRPGRLTALLGVSDLVVVDTEDVLLICHKNRSEEVKRVVQELKRRGRKDLI